MNQTIIDLYDRFTHGRMDRREFLDRLAALAGSTTAAVALLSMLQNDYAKAAIIAPDDARLAIDKVSYDSPSGKISGYLARPKAMGKRPAVLVIHENRGLNPHIEDVARRLAAEGFLALAPDLLSPLGGTPADSDEARNMIGKLDTQATVAAAVAGVDHLKSHAESTGKVGTVGFCWGGGITDRLAIASPALDAAVAYYGPIPPLDNVVQIHAPLLLHYAGLDTFVNPKIPDFEAALKKAGKDYTIYIYEGANHAFNNDTAGPRYNKKAAELAWSRTLAFFKQHLGAPPNAA